MALTVEDGTIVANANSYVSDSDYTTYATARGYTVGSTTSEREQEILKAMDYIESHRDEFKGLKATGTQSLQWPRYNVWIDSYQIDSNSIPDELKNAVMEAAVLTRSTSLVPSGSFQNVQRQKLEGLEVEYFNGGSWNSVQHKNVDIFLDVLLNRGGAFRSVRV